MVNEINKFSKNPADDLTERLAQSNQQLLEMQEEHRQLLEEMECLRQRAAALAKRNEEQEQEKEHQEQQLREQQQRLLEQQKQHQQQQKLEQQEQQQAKEKNNNGKHMRTVHSSGDHSDQNESTCSKQTIYSKTDSSEGGNSDEEANDYIQQKLAEIILLKAQYRRVESLINTTNIIEKHIANKKEKDSMRQLETTTEVDSDVSSSINNDVPIEKPHIESNYELRNAAEELQKEIRNQQLIEEEPNAMRSPSPSNPNIPNQDMISSAKKELLNSMVNMFEEFNSDLRSQADNLRAERERIRNLKELLKQSRETK